MDELETIFPGASEQARRMRALDWSRTDLGVPQAWPASLRTSLAICLTSRFPMVVCWGPHLTVLPNDAAAELLGVDALCRPWSAIGPMIEEVADGIASWSEDVPMFLDREIPNEEIYLTLSISPIPGVAAHPAGFVCVASETTAKVVDQRRLETLRELAFASVAATVEEACSSALSVLATNPRDLPFAALYLASSDGLRARLAATIGINDPALVPVRVTSADATVLPLAQVLHARHAIETPDTAFDPALPSGPWPEPARKAIVLPLREPGRDALVGLLVAGVSPRRPFDEAYRTWLELCAASIASAIGGARAYEDERKLADARAAIDRTRAALLANVTGALRDPIALICGPAEDLLAGEHGPLAPLQRAALDLALRNAHRLDRLVTAVTELSRIEAGRPVAAYEPTDLAGLTTEIAGRFRTAIEKAGLALEIDCLPLGEPAYVDRAMWQTIVANLVSNALRFTFDGVIGVRLRTDGDRVRLEVRDTGVGIPSEELPHLFERFHRIDGQRARGVGLGIGLALVDALVKLHGGEVRVTSSAERGTTLAVLIPHGTAHLPADRVRSTARASTNLPVQAAEDPLVTEALAWTSAGALEPSAALRGEARPRILIADRDPDTRAYLAHALANDAAIEVVEDAAAAREAVLQRPFDVVIAEAELDGIARTLRDNPATAHAAVIVTSAHVARSIDDGCDHMRKPFSAREVRARVRTGLELARARRAVREAREELHGKDEFLAMLGHELRNPLSPILTTLQLMRMRGTHAKELDVIERQVGHLTRLLDDLADVTRITRGKIDLVRRPIELAAIVEDAIEMARPVLERRGHVLDADVPAHGLGIDADPERIAQVIYNLLANAAKYSNAGTRIRIRAQAVAGRVRISVEDDGVGIAPEMLDRVFEVFVQQPETVERSRGGLGLGLAIVRGIVELHGGTVSARSDGPGRGSELTFDLPAATLPSPAAASTVAVEPIELPRTRRGQRILIVDDNEAAASSLRSALVELGYLVEVAYDGPAALEVAKRFKPQIALLDIGMPIMDGYELAQRLRAAREPTQELRLVAVTGFGRATDRRRTAEAGFQDHLVKPIDLAMLERIVEDLRA